MGGIIVGTSFQFKLFIVLNKAFETFDEKVMSRESETKGFKRQEPQLTKNDRFRNTEQQRFEQQGPFLFLDVNFVHTNVIFR